MVGNDLDVDSIWKNLSFFLKVVEFLLGVLSESELLTDGNLLSAWELEHRSSEGSFSVLQVLWTASDGHKDCTDVYSGSSSEWLSKGSSHTLLKSICSSTWEHLVNSENVPRVNSDSHVEGILTGLVLHVLVSSNSGSFKSFWSDLFLFSWNQMNATGEFIVNCLLLSNIVYSELGIRDTSAVSGFGVWLSLLVSIAPCWSSSHFLYKIINKYRYFLFR